MTIYFFVGSEFSSNTDFLALNQGAEQIKNRQQKIIFLSAWEPDLDALAKKIEPGDVIIGASAGGGAAASLAKKALALGKPKPMILGFEALGGLDEIDEVISITQANNPKSIHYNNHFMYELQDAHHELINGRKRYVYGHAFYAVHPSFVGRIQYAKDTATRIGDSAYILIPTASLTVGSKTYTYKNLISKTKDTQSFELDTTGSRVFQIDLIQNIVRSAKEHTLDQDEIVPGLRLKATSAPKNRPSEPTVNLSTQVASDPVIETELQINAAERGYVEIIEQFIQLVTDYKNKSLSKKASEFQREIMNAMDPFSPTLSLEAKIRNFYLHFVQVTEREGVLISNLNYMKKMDTSRSMLNLLAGIAAVLLIVLTLPVSVPLVAIIHKQTGRSPLDLFNTHVEQLSKEIELIKRKKLAPNFFNSNSSRPLDDENSALESENSPILT